VRCAGTADLEDGEKEKLALSCQRRKNRYIIQGFAELSWLSQDSCFYKAMKIKKFSKV
jgi:hypothetical protein